MKILVTGAAGFIGATLSHRLLARGDRVTGIDDLNNYYDVTLKQARLDLLNKIDRFVCHHFSISDRKKVEQLFEVEDFDVVVNLAAQAGVRHSIENPHAYIDSNLVGFCNILEGCRQGNVKHLVYASSSSVYGANTKLPFSESDNVDHPLSLYAASKKANELMAHSYSNLYDLPTTGLRFFTVYGPWGRPDMALFLFTRGILAGEAIPVFNHGNMVRDFTYVDDIIEGVVRVIDHIPQPDTDWIGSHPNPATSANKYRIYNIGNNAPQNLMRYIEVLEDNLKIKAKYHFMPMQPGDVPETEADTQRLETDIGYRPMTDLETGVARFVQWYRSYYQI